MCSVYKGGHNSQTVYYTELSFFHWEVKFYQVMTAYMSCGLVQEVEIYIQFPEIQSVFRTIEY